MAKRFFSFEEVLLCAAGLFIGAIVASSFAGGPNRPAPEPIQLERACNGVSMHLQDMALGRTADAFTQEVLQ